MTADDSPGRASEKLHGLRFFRILKFISMLIGITIIPGGSMLVLPLIREVKALRRRIGSRASVPPLPVTLPAGPDIPSADEPANPPAAVP